MPDKFSMDFSISNRAALLYDHVSFSNMTMLPEADSFVCGSMTNVDVLDKCTNYVSDKTCSVSNAMQSVSATFAARDLNDDWITEWHWDQLQVELRRLEKWTNRHMSDHSAFHQRQVEFDIQQPRTDLKCIESYVFITNLCG